MTTATLEILDQVKFDHEGYMENARDWTPEIAQALAAREGLVLTDRHWVVLNFIRKEYNTVGEPPTLRKITKTSGVDTKEMYQLFPGGPAKIAARIAGLKKPTGCI